MASVKAYLLTAAIASALTLAVATSGVGQAAERTATTSFGYVFVANPSKNPVPVAPQGTTSVQGSVAISNTPGVKIDPSGNTVQIANTSPISVALNDSAPSQPFQVTLSSTSPSYTLPSDKRLVIEEVSASANVYGVNNALFLNASSQANLQTTVAGNTSSYTFQIGTPFACSGSCSTNSVAYGGTQQVRLYADPGTNLQVGVTTAASGNGGPASTTTFWSVSISGYFVNAS